MSGLILYDKNCSWELDYVLNFLLKFLFISDKLAFTCQILDTHDLLKCTDTAEKRIVVFTSNLVTYAQIKPFLLRFKPHVIFHLSDEWGTKPEFGELANLTNVVLRQHWFPTKYAPNSKVFPIPLGFMTKFPHDSLKIASMWDRDLVWSFIGTINQPRRIMLEKLQTTFTEAGSFFISGGGVPIAEVANIYNRSVFVPNDRGAVRLDCFRLYEATLCGAIPVVVGTKEELQDTFIHDYGDEKVVCYPPWIFASSWDKAISKCKQILKNDPNREKLHALQFANLQWFKARTRQIQIRVESALTKGTIV